jgi:dipeptidyl aminopeptidase/acylaminoacyl peptidase
VVNFIRAGQFPGSDGSRLALLGGSYSSLHVQRLLQRNPNYDAAILLGPPTDLFDMRRRLEDRSFIPPFGLDQAMIALGLPDRVPMRYWRYSSAYHIRPDFPPLAILHSRTDEVVPFQQSELLSANLTQAGVAHETHFFDGASHYLLAEGGDADTLKIYDITLNFLAEHLK